MKQNNNEQQHNEIISHQNKGNNIQQQGHTSTATTKLKYCGHGF